MIPRTLHVVALIQLLGGLFAAIGIVVQLVHSHIRIDFAVLGIPIYFGLMRLKSGWRTCALVFIWAGMLLSPFAFIVGLGTSLPAHLHLFGIRWASVSAVWLSVAAVMLFLVSFWQYRVLTHPAIRAAFHQPAEGLPAN